MLVHGAGTVWSLCSVGRLPVTCYVARIVHGTFSISIAQCSTVAVRCNHMACVNAQLAHVRPTASPRRFPAHVIAGILPRKM
jgi:hypothetical protein